MPEDRYIPNPAHRDGRADKSQWLVSVDDEIRCHKVMLDKQWHNLDDGGRFGWGLLYDIDPDTGKVTIITLGITESQTESKIARFDASDVFSDGHREWH